ncbi:MAG: hypothetical protein HOP08_09520 [Cyclobacteriaceae bacterium]|nr:hypothetical protein [Cyclobacteriaceae bacterium]
MKKLIIILLVLAGFAAQSQNNLDAFLATNDVDQSISEEAKLKVHSFVATLSNAGLSEEKLLHRAFQKAHSTFLKKYEAYADFKEIFTTGRYDCLTATALFSNILDGLDFSYEVIETNYHIFLIVHTTKGEVLLETTDRWGGFITHKEEITKRIGEYHNNKIITASNGKSQYAYSFKLYQSVSPEKLSALLYFNQAVKAYNRRDLLAGCVALEKSAALYNSPRCGELGALLLNSVLELSDDEKRKTICINHLRNVQIKKLLILASN